MSLRARLIASENERYAAELTAAKARHDATLIELHSIPEQNETATADCAEWLSHAHLAQIWRTTKEGARKRAARLERVAPLQRRQIDGKSYISRHSLEAAGVRIVRP